MKRLILSVASASLLAIGTQAAHAIEFVDGFGINAQLAASGSKLRLAYAEYSVAREGSYDTVKQVFFKDTGNKQLDFHWVPNDPRPAGGPTTDMFYATDLVDGEANDGMGGTISSAVTTMQIDDGMAAWDAISCSSLPIVNLGAFGIDLGLVEAIIGGFGSSGLTVEGGITHGGWLPGLFFDIIAGPPGPGELPGSESILGVTFTFGWLNDEGTGFSDINSDGKFDAALREIYMNNNFDWEVGNDKGPGVYDIVAVMNHEQGHALSQAHFGEISLNKNGKLIISPKRGDNVMLAAIGSQQQFEGFHGSDIGGHCSIWANWPLQ